MDHVGSGRTGISIVMNCRDGEPYVGQAVLSVIEQSFSNWELIFFDNGSKDQSCSIVESFGESRIRVVQSNEDLPLGRARLKALSFCSRPFVAFLDSDDWWKPHHLETRLAMFDSEEVGVAYGNYEIFDEVTGRVTKARKGQLPSGRVFPHLARDYCVGFLTAVVRREALERLSPPFAHGYDVIHDFDLMVRLSLEWSFKADADPTAVYRRHSNSLTARRSWSHWAEIDRWLATTAIEGQVASQEDFWRLQELAKYKRLVCLVGDGRRSEAISQLVKMRVSNHAAKALVRLVCPDSMLRRFR